MPGHYPHDFRNLPQKAGDYSQPRFGYTQRPVGQELRQDPPGTYVSPTTGQVDPLRSYTNRAPDNIDFPPAPLPEGYTTGPFNASPPPPEPFDSGPIRYGYQPGRAGPSPEGLRNITQAALDATNVPALGFAGQQIQGADVRLPTVRYSGVEGQFKPGFATMSPEEAYATAYLEPTGVGRIRPRSFLKHVVDRGNAPATALLEAIAPISNRLFRPGGPVESNIHHLGQAASGATASVAGLFGGNETPPPGRNATAAEQDAYVQSVLNPQGIRTVYSQPRGTFSPEAGRIGLRGPNGGRADITNPRNAYANGRVTQFNSPFAASDFQERVLASQAAGAYNFDNELPAAERAQLLQDRLASYQRAGDTYRSIDLGDRSGPNATVVSPSGVARVQHVTRLNGPRTPYEEAQYQLDRAEWRTRNPRMREFYRAAKAKNAQRFGLEETEQQNANLRTQIGTQGQIDRANILAQGDIAAAETRELGAFRRAQMTEAARARGEQFGFQRDLYRDRLKALPDLFGQDSGLDAQSLFTIGRQYGMGAAEIADLLGAREGLDSGMVQEGFNRRRQDPNMRGIPDEAIYQNVIENLSPREF